MKKYLFLSLLVLVSCVMKINKFENNFKIDRPDIVFFDYNGTLYDDKKMLNEGCKKYCKWKTEADQKLFERLSANRKYDFLLTKLGEDALQQIYNYLVSKPFEVVEGSVMLLKELQKQNIPCYVITGTEGKKVKKWLTNAKLSQYFNDIYGKNDFGDLEKPNKDFAEKIKEVVRLKKQTCWMIGDSEQDIIMAKNLGCKCFIIDNFEEIKQNYSDLIDENILFMKYNEILNLVKKTL